MNLMAWSMAKQNVLLIGMARRLVTLIALVTLRGVAALQRPRRPASLQRLRRGAGPTHAWSNQDLTTDNAGREPIPDDDYVKQYQRDPALWPVEFFIIVYRRRRGASPEALVRRSANGTSKWGLGSGCPATRWAPSSSAPPRGYERSGVSFDARNFPQFRSAEPRSYDKIDVRADAFDGEDPELREFARWIRRGLRARFAEEEEAVRRRGGGRRGKPGRVGVGREPSTGGEARPRRGQQRRGDPGQLAHERPVRAEPGGVSLRAAARPRARRVRGIGPRCWRCCSRRTSSWWR